MKKGCTLLLLCIGLYSTAQTERVETNIVKVLDFITYAADYETTGEAQKIYLLVETSASGVSKESRFYIEQATQLLIRRLEEGDEIAIGTYGAVSGISLPYTQIADIEAVKGGITSLLQGAFTAVAKDGIAIAYELANEQADLETLHRIIMIKGSAQQQITTSSSAMRSAYLSKEIETLESNEKTEAIVEMSKLRKRQVQRSQRKQVKASQHNNLTGAIALTALTILPELLEIIKD